MEIHRKKTPARKAVPLQSSTYQNPSAKLGSLSRSTTSTATAPPAGDAVLRLRIDDGDIENIGLALPAPSDARGSDGRVRLRLSSCTCEQQSQSERCGWNLIRIIDGTWRIEAGTKILTSYGLAHILTTATCTKSDADILPPLSCSN